MDTPKPGSVPGGDGRSKAPTNIMPAKPPAPAANSGIKTPQKGFSGLLSSAQKFQQQMSAAPMASRGGVVADNPYANTPPPNVDISPQAARPPAQQAPAATPDPASPSDLNNQPSPSDRVAPPAAPPTPPVADRDGNGLPDTIQNPETLPNAELAPGVAPDAQGFPQSFPGEQELLPEDQYSGYWEDLGDAGADFAHTVAADANAGNLALRAKQQNAVGKAFSPGRFGSNTDDVNRLAQAAAKNTRSAASTLAKPITYPASKATDAARAAAQYVPGVNKVVNSPAAAQAARQASRFGDARRAISSADEMAKATGALGKTGKMFKALGSKAGPAGAVLEAGAIGYDLKNRMDQGQTFEDAYRDIANEHTQNVRNAINPFKWDMDGKDGVGWGDIANKAWSGLDVISPVAHVQAGGQLLKETGGGIKDMAVGSYNYLTDQEGKQRQRNVDEVVNMQNARASQFQSQAEQLKGQVDSTGEMSPEVKGQYDELLARAADARKRAENMVDETKNWELGNQNWLGGGNYFQQSMQDTGRRLDSEIAQLPFSQGSMTDAQKMQLENLRTRKNEIARMGKLYDEEAGYWGGTGDFEKSVRNNVRGAKNRMVQINQELREAVAQGDTNRIARLKSDLDHANSRLNDYRRWATDAANQREY